jgi:ATP-dependent DNA helicase RecG
MINDSSLQMRVYDNNISIWNEGTLPNGLSIEDLKIDHNSRPRNPIIANACFLDGYIDTWGRGTLKIFNSCIEAGLPEAEIKEMNGGVEVTLFGNPDQTLSEGLEVDFGKISERIRKDFGNELAKAFEIISKHPEYTAEQIAEEFDKTPRTIESYLAKLKKAGFIKRKGPKLGGFWVVLDG